jgi:hypothetical protein
MASEEHVPIAPRTLNGWKEIAAYLGKSVRSVQRWEITLHLPVHRIRTPDGQIVYAQTDEIDTWRRQLDRSPDQEDSDAADEIASDPLDASSPPKPAPSAEGMRLRSWRTALVATGAALVVFAAGMLAGMFVSRPSREAVEIKYVGQTIEAIGRDGALAWRHTFDHDVSGTVRGAPTFVDLDGDGEAEVLVPVRRSPQGRRASASDSLYCFSRTGTLKWSIAPDQTFSFGGRPYGAPWDIRDITVATTAAPRRIWIVFAHHTWHPAFVLEVDPDGASRVKYVQAGSLYSIAHWVTASGGYLAIGGTSEEFSTATLALMPDTIGAATFPIGVERLTCEGCPEGPPRRVLLVAAAELTAANHELFPYVNVVRQLGAGLKLVIRDGPGNSVIEVRPDFAAETLQYGQHYWASHRTLESKGLIDHPAERCPDRVRPRELREWTPDSGWRSSMITPKPDDVDGQ